MRRILIAFILFLPFCADAKLGGQALADSLLKVLPDAKEDTNKVRILKKIAGLYEFTHPEEGLKYIEQSLALAVELDWKKGIGDAYDILGSFKLNKSDFPAALDYYFQSLKINEERGDKDRICRNVGNIGIVYSAQSNYPKALEYFSKALKMSEEMGDKDGVAANTSNIADIYTHQKKYDSSLAYDQKALNSYEEEGNKAGVVAVLSNIGLVYHALNDNSKALASLLQGLKLSEEIGNKNYIAGSLGDIGNIYLSMAEDTSDAVRTDNLEITSKEVSLEKAIEYLEKAIVACKEIEMKDALIGFYKDIADAYALTGRYKEAFAYYKEYTALNDSVFSTDNKIKIANITTQRETDLKNKQIELNRIQQRNEVRERILFISCIGLLLLLIAAVMRNYNNQKKVNKQLNAEKLKSDQLALNLQESIVHKDMLADQLALSASMKSKFLANISHELRTPVTLLTGMLELMKDGTGTETGVNKEKLNVAYNNSRKLQYMVEEILDLSRLEKTETKIHTETMEIAPLVKRMVYAFETFIEKEKLTLEYDDQGPKGIYVYIDEDKLEKIINNLVYNAIKFNRPGGRINVKVSSSGDRKHAIITISDTGSGISKEDLPHIFERFYQSGSSKAKAQGAGIGLSLVKEFTLLLGGTVTVSSTLGVGSVFTLQFPVNEKVSNENELEREMIADPTVVWNRFAGNQTILIVEDNDEMRYYLKSVLGDKVNLAEARNGKEALKWLENNHSDLIISDMMMPEMDGREFVTELKKSDLYRKIPVITLTALADLESQLNMLHLGVDDYIVKPFNSTELRIRVSNLLGNLEERKLFSHQPAEPDDIPADGKEADEFRSKITAYVTARMKNTNVSVYDLAYELGLSERQLYRLAKSLTGYTPAQLIKEVRLQKAYELLVSGGINKIEDVARRVGFESAGYFSRQFFERFGKRATEFL